MILDYGATIHMMKDEKMLTKPKPSSPTTVSTGDGSKLESSLRGRMVISSNGKIDNTTRLLLSRVLHVPGLDSNLISCSELARDGYVTSFAHGQCIIRKHGRVVAKARELDELYMLDSVVLNKEESAHVAR